MSSFDDRREAAQEEIESEKADVKAELKRLRQKKGRLEGQNAPSAQIQGIERRVSTLQDRLSELNEADPVDRVDEPAPTPRRFHSL